MTKKRLRRKSYVILSLVIIIINIYVGQFLDFQTEYDIQVSSIYIICMLIISTLLNIFRLHDINLSGWYALLVFIPIFNLGLIALFFIDGTVGENKYGKDPKGRNKVIKKQINPSHKDPINTTKIIKFEENDIIHKFDTRMNLLKESLDYNLITREEYDDKVELLNQESLKLKRIEEKKAEEEEKEKLKQEKIALLNKLLSQGLIAQDNFNEKIEQLNSRKTIATMDKVELKITRKDNFYGYVDKQNEGNVVIEHIFDDAFPFNEGLAAVIYKNKRGFINLDGKFDIPPIYDKEGTYFNKGLATVYLEGKKLVISKSGEIISKNI